MFRNRRPGDRERTVIYMVDAHYAWRYKRARERKGGREGRRKEGEREGEREREGRREK